jgi:hypothetical protein
VQRADGTCDCGLDTSVEPGGTMTNWVCDGSGRFGAAARAVEDFGAGCFPGRCE